MSNALDDITTQIRLLLACGDLSFALALSKSIAACGRGKIACHVVDIPKLIDRALQLKAEVVVLEHVAGQEARTWNLLTHIERCCPSARVLLLCEICNVETITRAIRKGAKGCALKSIAPSLLVKAVTVVRGGDVWFGRAALFEAARTQVLAAAANGLSPAGDQQALTARQREVLALAGNAMSNKEIARVLNISDKTVKTHLHRIYVKLQQSGRYKVLFTSAQGGSTQATTPSGLQ